MQLGMYLTTLSSPAKCKAKAANTSVLSQPFRDYTSRSTRPHRSRFYFSSNNDDDNKAYVQRGTTDTCVGVPSAKRKATFSTFVNPVWLTARHTATSLL